VLVNGSVMLQGLDLSAQHGIGRAATYTEEIVARGGKGIVVSFAPVKGKTILNAIRVRRR
jgi:hypothetical protein